MFSECLSDCSEITKSQEPINPTESTIPMLAFGKVRQSALLIRKLEVFLIDSLLEPQEYSDSAHAQKQHFLCRRSSCPFAVFDRSPNATDVGFRELNVLLSFGD